VGAKGQSPATAQHCRLLEQRPVAVPLTPVPLPGCVFGPKVMMSYTRGEECIRGRAVVVVARACAGRGGDERAAGRAPTALLQLDSRAVLNFTFSSA
jgi:hypothetical protein